MNKIRVNITISPHIHEKSKYWAQREHKSFSEVVEDLMLSYCESKEEPTNSIPEGTNVYIANSQNPKNDKSIKNPTPNEILEPFLEYSQPIYLQKIQTIAAQLSIESQQNVLRYMEFIAREDKVNLKTTMHGALKDKIQIAPDFDEPLAQFSEYMP